MIIPGGWGINWGINWGAAYYVWDGDECDTSVVALNEPTSVRTCVSDANQTPGWGQSWGIGWGKS